MKFKIGDVVRRIKDESQGLPVGSICRVTAAANPDEIFVDFPGRDGMSYYSRNFELVSQEAEPQAQQETRLACLRCTGAYAVDGLDGFWTHCAVVEDNRKLKARIKGLEARLMRVVEAHEILKEIV